MVVVAVEGWVSITVGRLCSLYLDRRTLDVEAVVAIGVAEIIEERLLFVNTGLPTTVTIVVTK